jgi:hypothetical protein
VAYPIFYIISEYPKIKHVPDKVNPPTVNKHEGYRRQNHCSQEIFTEQLWMKESGRYNPITGYKIRQVRP